MEGQRSQLRRARGAGLVVPALVATGLLIGACGSDGPDGRTNTSVPSAPVTVPRSVTNDPAPSESGGDVQSMIDQHQAMMDQMRVSATPQMLQMMNDDPMWQMMRSGEFIKLLEEHEGDIDQMLGRTGG
jgi:hypothetical protein